MENAWHLKSANVLETGGLWTHQEHNALPHATSRAWTEYVRGMCQNMSRSRYQSLTIWIKFSDADLTNATADTATPWTILTHSDVFLLAILHVSTASVRVQICASATRDTSKTDQLKEARNASKPKNLDISKICRKFLSENKFLFFRIILVALMVSLAELRLLLVSMMELK